MLNRVAMGSVKLKHYAILNDIHFPFEDKPRYKLALKIMKSLPLDGIYLNGDIGEFLSVSSHARHPAEQIPLVAEIEYINRKFDELQEMFPDIPVTLIEGNHCYRFFRYIRDVAPQMWGLLDCPSLLKFPDRPRWKFVPYGPSQLVLCGDSSLYLRHEPLAGGLNHAKGTATHSSVDLAYGHTHQYQIATHKKFGPVPYTTRAYSLGWLGDETRPVFDYRGSKDSWVKGMTIVTCDPVNGDYDLKFIDMSKLPIMFEGKRFDAK